MPPPVIGWRDVALFLHSARTDAALDAARRTPAAFEAAYAAQADPWLSASPRYLYQTRKYDRMLACLPAARGHAAALDLGCGIGMLAERLAGDYASVLGMDIAPTALHRAAGRTAATPGLHWRQGDIAGLPDDLDCNFDLVVLADTLYYLPPPITDAGLAIIAARMARLLRPGGLILLANHYVMAADRGSRLTRRIHDAFASAPALARISTARRWFFLADVLVAR